MRRLIIASLFASALIAAGATAPASGSPNGSGNFAVQAFAKLTSPSLGVCASTATVTWENVNLVDEVYFKYYVNGAAAGTYAAIISPAQSSGSVTGLGSPSVPQGQTFYFTAALYSFPFTAFATSRTLTC